MKKFTFFFFSLIIAVITLKAQSLLSIDPNSFNIQVPADERGEATSYVSNNSSVERTIRWVRIADNVPAGWDSYVCDKNECYLTNTYTQTFVLSPNTKGLLQLTISPNGLIGQAQFHVLAYDVNDSAGANAILSVSMVAESPTGINDPKQGNISIYPIPAKDVLNVSLNTGDHVTSIEIYNVVGQKMKSINVNNAAKMITVPVNDLKKGIYFVRAMSYGQDLATKTFTKE